ncbi:hypothetical protein [Microbacterium proteolyticum]|uniref:hypothetical protein n=1 Tax=Microbacterium proteolyticum TaxID=1572644 RepID=UPI0035C146DE
MSTSETPENPPLTRRQLRELRNTGATPIITPQPDAAPENATAPAAEPQTAHDAPPAEAPDAAIADVAADAADAASEGESVAPATDRDEPVAESDAGADPETVPEPPAKKGGVLGGLFGRNKADKAAAEPVTEPAPADDAPASGETEADAVTAPDTAPEPPLVPATFPPSSGPDLGVTGLTRRQVRAQERIRTASVPIISPDLEPGVPTTRDETAEPVSESAIPSAESATSHDADTDAAASATNEAETAARDDSAGLQAIFRPAAPEEAEATDETATDDPAPVSTVNPAPVSTVNPALGSDLLKGQTPEISLPPSFDQLISRSAAATGSVSTPNALILSQTPAGVPLVGPVTSTGEVLITGTFELPEGLGSAGHAPGTTDGRDVDAVLLDGELPPASSPTPIAASAAISTVKQPGEIIRPPAPEKGSKLVIGLIITTGALAVAVAVALVLAFTTGVFG